MQDRQIRSGGCFVGHGRAPYPIRALATWAAGALMLLLLLVPLDPAGAAPQLSASGRSRSFEVKVAGGHATFEFLAIAGCRYRLTAAPGTLQRPILEVGRPEEEPFVRVDAGASGASAVHLWDAEGDGRLQARVGGFSAQVGTGTLTLETLGPEDKPVQAHRRFLWPGVERARVGDLLLGAANEWELVVTPGTAYEISATQGSAGRVRLRVLGWNDEVLADSTQAAVSWVAWPPVRFRAPEQPAPVPAGGADKKKPRTRKHSKKRPPAIRLEVRALLDGGGTYGVRMRALGEGEAVDADPVPAPAEVERGPVEGEPQTFRAGPGDLGIVYVPLSPQRTQVVEMLRGRTWVQVGDMGLQGSARSQENALISWFRPYYPGTYRFRAVPAPPPSEPHLMLHDRAVLGSAPMHMGTGADPQVRAQLASGWTLVGLGVCMPGWDYLYVCVGAPEQGVAMRVRDDQGKTIRTRSARDRHISPGLGPSLRFEAPRAGVYRLEAKGGRRHIVRPLLRRASN